MKPLFPYLLILLVLLAVPTARGANATDTIPDSIASPRLPLPLDPDSKKALLDSAASRWGEWQTMALSGKFKMAGLPVNPSVKIFMERDSLILLSLRAPFLGEVGRAEITDSTILAVNKMNQTYMEEPLEKVLSYYPGTLSDLQDLLLGRMAIPGAGLLDGSASDAVDVYAETDGTFTVVAAEEFRIPGCNYGYVLDSSLANRGLMVVPTAKDNTLVSLTFDTDDNNQTLEFAYQTDRRNYRATLQLNQPEWGAKPFAKIKLGKQYRRLDPVDFLGAVGK